MYSEADILELTSKVRADSTHLLSAQKLARRVAQQFIHSRYENSRLAQYEEVDSLCMKIVRRLKNFDRPECGRTLATEPVITSTQIWAERVLLMRVETLKARETEESERLWKREEEAREQSERLWMREEEAREQSERHWKREQDAREQEEEAREQEEEAREQEEEAREQEEESREQLRKRKESQMSSYSEVIQESLLQRNRVRDRVIK
jgi:hypothetical protein